MSTIAAIGLWFLKNPVWLLVILLGAGLGVQTIRLNVAEAGEAKAKLEFSDFKKDLAEQNAAAERANAERSAAKAQKLADDFMAIQATSSEVKEALNAAKSSGACEHDPKWHATISGMKRIANDK